MPKYNKDPTRIPKPQLHGLLASASKITVPSALLSGVLSGVLFQIFYVNRKQNLYKCFYENYDIEQEFERMRSKGLFDSC